MAIENFHSTQVDYYEIEGHLNIIHTIKRWLDQYFDKWLGIWLSWHERNSIDKISFKMSIIHNEAALGERIEWQMG